MDRAHGIDVSHHHKVLDWGKVYAQGFHIFGAKATNGRGVDDAFPAHAAGAREGGFDLVLYYHFPTPRSSAVSQADHFFNVVSGGGGLRPNERLALDVEWDTHNKWFPPIQFVEEFTRELLRLVDDRRHFVYTSDRIWDEFLHRPAWASAIATDLWVPRYQSGGAEPVLPHDAAGRPVWPRWTIWQDSEKYLCPGVDGPCDHNVWRGDAEDLRGWMARGGATIGGVL